MDYYEILGLSSGASQEQIRRAYRTLAKKYHPDRNPSPEAAARMSEINDAYDVLSDPVKRRAYDSRFTNIFTYAEPRREDPREAYKREYLRKRREEDRKAWESRRRWQQRVHTIMWYACIPVALLGALLVIDSRLPPVSSDSRVHTTWVARDKEDGQYYGFLAATGARMIVSVATLEAFEQSYPKPPIYIHTSTILGKDLGASIEIGGVLYTMPPESGIFNPGFPWPIFLLICAIVALSMPKYSTVSSAVATIALVSGLIVAMVLNDT